MVHFDLRACLLMVSLSAVVGNGCTRVDTRIISGQRLKDQGHDASKTPHVKVLASPDHDEFEPPPVTPEPTLETLLLETALPQSEVEALLNELDTTLLMLEDFLGSTENWDVTQP